MATYVFAAKQGFFPVSGENPLAAFERLLKDKHKYMFTDAIRNGELLELGFERLYENDVYSPVFSKKTLKEIQKILGIKKINKENNVSEKIVEITDPSLITNKNNSNNLNIILSKHAIQRISQRLNKNFTIKEVIENIKESRNLGLRRHRLELWKKENDNIVYFILPLGLLGCKPSSVLLITVLMYEDVQKNKKRYKITKNFRRNLYDCI